MVQFKQDDTAALIIVTLKENVSIAEPYYLFVFRHVLTKQKIKFVKSEGQDESNNIERYNQFTIDASVVFANGPIGEWHYTVYEQVSPTNTDETLTGNELEFGKLYLDRATEFQFTKYNEPQSFKVYNG